MTKSISSAELDAILARADLNEPCLCSRSNDLCAEHRDVLEVDVPRLITEVRFVHGQLVKQMRANVESFEKNEELRAELARQAEAHRGEVAALTEALNQAREQRDRYRAALATTDAPADLLRALDGQPAGGAETRYFLTLGNGAERAVSMDEFVAAERTAGFNNTMGRPDLPATGGFDAPGVKGRVEYVQPADGGEDRG